MKNKILTDTQLRCSIGTPIGVGLNIIFKKKVKYEKLSELFLDAYQAAVNEHLKIGTQRQIYQNRGNTHHD